MPTNDWQFRFPPCPHMCSSTPQVYSISQKQNALETWEVNLFKWIRTQKRFLEQMKNGFSSKPVLCFYCYYLFLSNIEYYEVCFCFIIFSLTYFYKKKYIQNKFINKFIFRYELFFLYCTLNNCWSKWNFLEGFLNRRALPLT